MAKSNLTTSPLRIVPVGNSVSLFLLISYLLCIGFGLLAPEQISM